MKVFMVFDTHEVELPNHPAALRNINWSDPRVQVRQWGDGTVSVRACHLRYENEQAPAPGTIPGTFER